MADREAVVVVSCCHGQDDPLCDACLKNDIHWKCGCPGKSAPLKVKKN